MLHRWLARSIERIRSFWDLEDPEEPIEGTGEVYLDPAYNNRYEAERNLQELSEAAEHAEEFDDGMPPEYK